MTCKLTEDEIRAMSDGERFELLRMFEDATGWRLRTLTRGDAETAYSDSEADEPLTDEEWRALSDSREWNSLGDVSESDWENVHGAVYSVLGSPADRAATLGLDGAERDEVIS
jgi:hypothetical protein